MVRASVDPYTGSASGTRSRSTPYASDSAALRARQGRGAQVERRGDVEVVGEPHVPPHALPFSGAWRTRIARRSARRNARPACTLAQPEGRVVIAPGSSD